MPALKAYFVSTYALAKMVLLDKRFQKMPTLKDGSKFVPASKVRRRYTCAIRKSAFPCIA